MFDSFCSMRTAPSPLHAPHSTPVFRVSSPTWRPCCGYTCPAISMKLASQIRLYRPSHQTSCWPSSRDRPEWRSRSLILPFLAAQSSRQTITPKGRHARSYMGRHQPSRRRGDVAYRTVQVARSKVYMFSDRDVILLVTFSRICLSFPVHW